MGRGEVCKERGLAYSTFDKEEKIVEYVKTLENVTVDDIRAEYINYINSAIPKEKGNHLTKSRHQNI